MMELALVFWKNYLASDELQRRTLLQSLPLLKNLHRIIQDKNIVPEMIQFIVLSQMQGYIDDCISCLVKEG